MIHLDFSYHITDYKITMMRFYRTLICLIFVSTFFSAAALFAQQIPGDASIFEIKDSADIRAKLWKTVINADIITARNQKPVVLSNGWGQWKISYSTNPTYLYTIISPERNGKYADYMQGTWIFRRSLKTGAFDQVKIFLLSSEDTFMRVYPFEERTKADIIIFGAVIYHEVIIPLSFENLAAASMKTIINATNAVIDWSLFAPEPVLYTNAQRLIENIRLRLPELSYNDDGAIDNDKLPRLIRTLELQQPPYGLNCSGFLKWITDGMLYPYTGTLLSIQEIKERMLDNRGSSFTKPFEETYDPYFGIDWIRALARSAWNVVNNTSQNDPLRHDVDEPTFSLMVNGTNPISGGVQYRLVTQNFQDAGFEIQALIPMLYLLALREPNNMYYAALSARAKIPPYLRRFFHVAAIIPYFTQDGIFTIAVFESAAETSISRIIKSRQYDFVKLVRMPITVQFEPPKLQE